MNLIAGNKLDQSIQASYDSLPAKGLDPTDAVHSDPIQYQCSGDRRRGAAATTGARRAWVEGSWMRVRCCGRRRRRRG